MRLYGKLEGPFPKIGGHVYLSSKTGLCAQCGHPEANHVDKQAPAPPSVYEKDGGLYWDCDCNMSKPALHRFTYALIQVAGHFTCSLTIGCQGYTAAQNARNTVFFRVWIPKGMEAEFTRISGMMLQVPPILKLS